MSDVDHHALMEKFESVFSSQDWARLGEIIAEDAVWEYPQSGEVFRGLANIRGQLENYPDLEAGSTKLQEVLGGTEAVTGEPRSSEPTIPTAATGWL